MSVKSLKKTAVIKTKYGSYGCLFEPEPDMGGYVVTAPRVQGVVSWGKNLAEAKRMAIDAIEGIIEVRILVEAERNGEVRFINRRSREAVLA